MERRSRGPEIVGTGDRRVLQCSQIIRKVIDFKKLKRRGLTWETEELEGWTGRNKKSCCYLGL
jgi:hypothetical protein